MVKIENGTTKLDIKVNVSLHGVLQVIVVDDGLICIVRGES